MTTPMAAGLELNNGQRVPAICFGGGQRIRDGAVFEDALKVGYRFFDTAFSYRNDHLLFASEIGRRVLAEERASVVICSKTGPTHDLPVAADEALKRMGSDYIDLLLLHHPIDLNADDRLGSLRRTWAAMEQLVDAGKVRALGLSNTGVSLLRFVLDFCRIPPSIDQVEFHPYVHDRALLDACDAAGVRLQAYCPLGSPWRQEAMGRQGPAQDPVVAGIAEAKGKAATQIILRWHIDKSVIPVVSATQPDHMRANLDVFDFRLTRGEIAAIDALDRQERIWRDVPKLAGHFGAVEDGVLVIPETWP